MSSAATTKHWDLHFLRRENNVERSKTALIILNQSFTPELLIRLWVSSSWHACADGGANRLYDLFSNEEERTKFLPDLIKGDLDSIRDEVRAYYSDKGVVVEDCSQDQDSTDLQKCLASLCELEAKKKTQYVALILGGLSGRLDQTVHVLSQMYKLRKERGYTYVVTDDNVAWVLDSGEHTVNLDLQDLGKTCGLLPIGISETVLSTQGLQWNIDNYPSSLDGQMSTSNRVVESEVWIKTSQPICWCVEWNDILEPSSQSQRTISM